VWVTSDIRPLTQADIDNLVPNKIVPDNGDMNTVIRSAMPDDVIMLRNGNYTANGYNVLLPSGTAEHPITIIAESQVEL